jgi:hypothetical protein
LAALPRLSAIGSITEDFDRKLGPTEPRHKRRNST